MIFRIIGYYIYHYTYTIQTKFQEWYINRVQFFDSSMKSFGLYEKILNKLFWWVESPDPLLEWLETKCLFEGVWNDNIKHIDRSGISYKILQSNSRNSIIIFRTRQDYDMYRLLFK